MSDSHSHPTTSPPVTRLWLAVLCGYLALGATLQTLPSFVVHQFHASTALAGLSVGVAFAATACTRPFAGRRADHGGARPVVALGGVLTALGGLGHWWAPNVTMILLSRVVMGAGEGALFSAALPWVLASASADRRGRVAGWFGLSMWGGLALGPLVAALIQQIRGVRGVWQAVVVLGVAAAVLVLTTPRQRGAATATQSGAQNGLVPAGAIRPGLVFGLSAYGYGTITALIVLYLAQQALGGTTIALALFALGFLGTRLVGSPAVDRLGGRRVATTTLGVEAGGLGLIAAVPTTAGALVGTFLAGIGVSLMYPATVWMTLQRTGPLRPGTSVGVMTSFWDLGIMIAGPLSGALVAPAGFRAAFATATAVALMALGIAVRTHPHVKTQPSTLETAKPGVLPRQIPSTPCPGPPEPEIDPPEDAGGRS